MSRFSTKSAMLPSDCFGSVPCRFTRMNPTNVATIRRTPWEIVSPLRFLRPELRASGHNTFRLHIRQRTRAVTSFLTRNTSTSRFSEKSHELRYFQSDTLGLLAGAYFPRSSPTLVIRPNACKFELPSVQPMAADPLVKTQFTIWEVAILLSVPGPTL